MSQDIKVTGTPQTFGDGAIRNTKDGKGRYDLIPPEPFKMIVDRIVRMHDDYQDICINQAQIYLDAFVERDFIKTIIELTAYGYAKYPPNSQAVKTEDFSAALWDMLHDLAVHFEKGAKIYGEHNCEKGIPEWSFLDSGIRHMTQVFEGKEDEPHLISSIWNFWMLVWSKNKSVE